MTTRTAEANGHRCPYCGGRVKRDLKRRGFVVHPQAARAVMGVASIRHEIRFQLLPRVPEPRTLRCEGKSSARVCARRAASKSAVGSIAMSGRTRQS